MSIKQDRAGTRTSEDLRRRLNVAAIDDSVKKSDSNAKDINELNTYVTAISETLNNTRENYVSTQSQTFTNNQKQIARTNIGAGTSSFSGSYNDLSNKPNSLSNINTNEYNKLSGIEARAEVNLIESIKLNGITQPITNKEVNIIVSSGGTYEYYHTDGAGYIWFNDGFLIQWGRISVTPTTINTDITARLTYNHTYDNIPDIKVTPLSNTPSIAKVSAGGGTTIALSKSGMNIYVNSSTTRAVNVAWSATGHKAIP